ncbi:MAG: EAL domain-containing protein [Geminicoccaceae bacterium]|nr:EAL domain-containing protein [Geminicoccaceae bacterium]
MKLMAGYSTSLVLAGVVLLPASLLPALEVPGAALWFLLLAASQGTSVVARFLRGRKRYDRSFRLLDWQVLAGGALWGAGGALLHDGLRYEGHSLLPLLVVAMLAGGFLVLHRSPGRQLALFLSTCMVYAGGYLHLHPDRWVQVVLLAAMGALVLVMLGIRARQHRALVHRLEAEQRKSRYELRTTRSELSASVRERTRELRDSNARLNSEIEIRHRSEERIRFLLEHDSLTGLPNRILLMRRLDEALEAARSAGHPVAVMMIDLDGFKQVNDTLGHHAGDALLKHTASSLLAVTASEDTVARMGGDEFAIVSTGIRRPHDAAQLAERILHGFHMPFEVDGNRSHVLASLGVALFPENGTDPGALLLHADQALYEAKSFGRGRYSLYSEELDAHHRNRTQLERDLRQAVERRQLQLLFQPRYTLKTQALVAAEVSLRWKHPLLGNLQSPEFLPLAETTGLIGPMGRWILSETCSHARRWQHHGAGTQLAINLSQAQLRQYDIARQILQALDAAKLPPERLGIEISETALARGDPGLAGQLQRIKSLGVHLTLDHFGTGAASFDSIRSMPFDKLKIDRRFIRHMPENSATWAVVKAAVTFARGMGWTSIADGVEDERQLDGLLALGCDEAQGPLLGQPASGEALEPVPGGNWSFAK